MRLFSPVLLALVIASSASAQQPPEDPKITAYRQLLSEANERVVTYAAQAQQLSVENVKLKTDLAKATESKKEPPKAQ